MARRGAREVAQAMAEKCLGARVRMLNRAVTRIYEEHLRPLGVKLPQLNILTVVTLREPVVPGEVARLLSLEKSTLSRNLALMEEHGWIESRAGEGGRRAELRTTADGRRLLRSSDDAWQAAQREAEELLGKGVVQALLRGADRLP